MIHSSVKTTVDETATKGTPVLKCGTGECVTATWCHSLAEEESNTALVSLRKWCTKELAKMLAYQPMKKNICPLSSKKKERKRHFYLKVSQIIFNLQSHLSLNVTYTYCQFRFIKAFCETGMRFKTSDRNYSHLSLLLTSILKCSLPQIEEINKKTFCINIDLKNPNKKPHTQLAK